jgi:hypothetical protein
MTTKEKTFNRYEAAINEMYEKKEFIGRNIIKTHRISTRTTSLLAAHGFIETKASEGSTWIGEQPTKEMIKNVIKHLNFYVRAYRMLNSKHNKIESSDIWKLNLTHILSEETAIETLKNSEKYIYKITRTLKNPWEEVS